METLRSKILPYEKTIGTLASGLAIVMFFSLIEVLLSNLRGDSNIFIQPSATALNGLFWSLYAFSKNDKYLLIPNLLALLIGIVTAVTAFV